MMKQIIDVHMQILKPLIFMSTSSCTWHHDHTHTHTHIAIESTTVEWLTSRTKKVWEPFVATCLPLADPQNLYMKKVNFWQF